MIKKVNEKNISKCVELIKNSFLTVANEFNFTIENAPMFTAFAINEEKLNYQFHKEHRPMYAFFDKNIIVGYYSLQLLDDNECELNNLCVHPNHRHRGIGKELIKHALNTAKEFNCNKMNIGIIEENTILRKWYESLGFTHTKTKKFDFFPFTCGYMKKEL